MPFACQNRHVYISTSCIWKVCQRAIECNLYTQDTDSYRRASKLHISMFWGDSKIGKYLLYFFQKFNEGRYFRYLVFIAHIKQAAHKTAHTKHALVDRWSESNSKIQLSVTIQFSKAIHAHTHTHSINAV